MCLLNMQPFSIIGDSMDGFTDFSRLSTAPRVQGEIDMFRMQLEFSGKHKRRVTSYSFLAMVNQCVSFELAMSFLMKI